MPREHGRETYESEAALRALRGISQVAVSPTASTGFRPSVAEQRQARTTSEAVEFTVLASSFATMPPFSSYHLAVGTATPEKPVYAGDTLFADKGKPNVCDFSLNKFGRLLRLNAINNEMFFFLFRGSTLINL